MRDRLRQWFDQLSWKKVAADWTLGQVVAYAMSLLSAAVLTWWADPSIPRAGRVIYFLGVAIALGVIWVLFTIGWRWLYPIPKEKAASVSVPNEGAEDESGERRLDGSPIMFVVDGAWLNTPFACQSLGTNERGEPQYGEDLNLMVIAHKLMENVRLTIVVKDAAEAKPRIEYHHQGLISGTVTPGMRERIRLFRRTFCLADAAISVRAGHTLHTSQREDVGASFFEGVDERAVLLPEIYNVDIAVYHRQGQERCSFNLDLRSIEAPRSRLIPKRGNLHVRVPNNYTSPDLPPTAYTR